METLPTLTGTEKQIAWAAEIRAAIIDTYTKIVAQRTPAQVVQMQPVYDYMVTQTAAGWWIDRRSDITAQSLDIIAKEYARQAR